MVFGLIWKGISGQQRDRIKQSVERLTKMKIGPVLRSDTNFLGLSLVLDNFPTQINQFLN